MGGCLGDDTIAAYVDGVLSSDEIAGADRHIDTCATCRGQLSAMAATTDATPTTPPAAAITDLAPGSSLGRYVVVGVLGRGGMGVVVRAYDPELARHVAIKLVDPSLPDGSRAPGSWRARLRDEARAMARLRHPNVIAVHDAGGLGDRLFVAMELVEGESLGRWLERHGRRDALAMCVAAGRGLCAAHAAGLVHGDVKPDNILVDRDGRAMIGDFGLARAVADVAADDGGRVLCGTPAYMAPELFRGQPADQRSDQLAFAVTVYEAMTGARPWRGDSVSALRAAIAAGPPARPAAIPSWLWPIVARGLAPDAGARHPSLVGFVDALERAARRRRLRVPVAAAAAVVMIGAGMTAVAVAQTGPDAVTCRDPEARTRAVADRARARCAGDASPACARLTAMVEARLTSWRAAHVEVCRATREGRQSAELLDARMGCLDRRLAEHDALIEQIASTQDGAAGVLAAIIAVERLDDASDCRAIERAGGPPPPRGRADAIARADAWVAAATASYELGRFQTGLDALASHVDAIVALEHAPLTARASRMLALLQRETGRLDDAEATIERGMHAAALAGDDYTGAALMLELADLVAEGRGDPDRGAELLRAAAAAVVRAGNPPALESSYLIQRGALAETRGDLAEAATDFNRAFELRHDAGGADAPDTAVALQRLCGVESQLGQWEKARAHCQQALAILQATLGADHPAAAQAESELGVATAIEGDLRGARERWASALASLERSVGARSPALVPVLLNLADVSGMLDEGEIGRTYLDRALALTRDAPDDPERLELRLRVARNLRARGESAAAATMLDDVARRADTMLGARHPTTAAALSQLAKAHYEADRLDDARSAFERAIAAYAAINGPRHPVTLGLEGHLGQTLMSLDQPAQARPVFERVMLAMEATVDDRSPFLAQAYSNMADCLIVLGEPEPAVELAERALAIREALAPDPLQLAEVRWILGQALWRSGRDRKRAVALVTRARADMRAIGAAAYSLPRVERWLAGKR